MDTIEARFWPKVDRRGDDDCWPWRGVTNNKGYGMIRRGAASLGKALAHRVSYELAHGPIPRGPTHQSNIVLHTCDNPICVNPKHLRLGNMKANYDDMAAKGRRRIVAPAGDAHWTRQNPAAVPRGEANGFSKMTEADVRAIYQRCLAGIDFSNIGREFGLDPSTVSDICRGHYWAHMLGTPGCPTLAELQDAPRPKSTRLTAEAVTAIRNGAASGATARDLARAHSCSLRVVIEIIKRLSWKHLP
jgi:hypothetical protein